MTKEAGSARLFLWGGRLREDNQRDLASSGPLGGETLAAVHSPAVGRIESEDALLLPVDAYDHLVVGVRAPAVALHQANQDRMVPMDFAIEVGELALDEESLQTLSAGEIAEGSRLDASLGSGRGGGNDAVTCDRELPIVEHHGQCSGTAVFVSTLAHYGHAFHHFPARLARQVGELRVPGGA